MNNVIALNRHRPKAADAAVVAPERDLLREMEEAKFHAGIVLGVLETILESLKPKKRC